MTPRDEPARDAWLSEALRHAPDADAAPAPELSEAILRSARQAVSPSPAPARINPLLRWWAWLARPPVAAGFATLMVATLVGVMWWDQPLDDAIPRRAPAAATPIERGAAAPPPAPAAVPSPEPAQTQGGARADKEASRGAAAPTAPPSPEPAPKRERTERAREARVDESRRRAADASASPPLPPPPAAPAPFAASPPPAPAAPAAVAENAARSAVAPARDELAEQRAPARALAKAAAPAATSGGLVSRRQETVLPAIDQPERWRWQRGASAQPMTGALQRWLVQLDRVARWRPADGAAPAVPDEDLLRLSRDGVLHATISLGPEAVWLTPAEGAPLMAPLSGAAAASLRAALREATP